MTDSAELNIADLLQLKRIIELSCQRGAFQAAEMTAVGITYEKLTRFLESLEQQSQKSESQGDLE